MWWILLRRRRRSKNPFFVILVLVGIIIICLGLFIFWITNQNRIAYLYLKYQANNALQSAERRISDLYSVDPVTKHPELSDTEVPDGVRGNGLNLLLIDRISSEGYIKELLELYRDSSQGKLNDYSFHLPVEALLGMHKNETGTYGTAGVVPKSYIPYDSKTKKILWGLDYKGIPGSAITLRSLNENVINGAPAGDGVLPYTDPNKLPYTINGINHLAQGRVHGSGPSRDVGMFQISRFNFHNTSTSGWVVPAKISGYKSSSSRTQSDAYYLPDMLSYLDAQFSSMINKYGLGTQDVLTQVGAYSMYHNAGEYSWSWGAGFGVNFRTSEKITGIPGSVNDSNRWIVEEYGKNTAVIPKDIIQGISKYSSKIQGLHSRSVAALLLLEDGYYLSPTALDELTTGSLKKYTPKAWQALYGEKVNASSLRKKLQPYVKSVTDVYPDYLSRDAFNAVYGFAPSMDSNTYGGIWKLDTATSPAYKVKANGADPRVLHYSNLVTIGHVVDSTTNGTMVYANLLKLSGVGIDPTNPADYVNTIKNEFVPESTEFSSILKRLGVTEIDSRAQEMLEKGYEMSGFWYFLGGQGKAVSSENWDSHASYRFVSSASSVYAKGEVSNRALLRAYETKDGSDPSASPKNRRNDNLVNYGRILLDCSQLTGIAYNTTIRGTDPLVSPNSTAQFSSNLLTTIKDWNAAKPGDIFVRKGHVFFFISKNTSGSAMILDPSISKTEGDQRVPVGKYWVLEAHDYDTRVGIRARTYIDPDKYILRRFKKLM
jgi:hypothetical protein